MKLKIISLGGFGRVTQNLFVYENEQDILLVDCGIGFPTRESPKGDLLVPDISYLESVKSKIRGLVLTHGHEDHYGGLPFVLPKLGNIPIFASRLTAALAKEKLDEYKIRARINTIDSDQKITLNSFSLEFVHVTHSIPDTLSLAIHTPLGTIVHTGDFKFDWTPVMGKQPEVGKIASIGNKGVLLLVSDCLRSEKVGYTLSEAMIGDSFEREIRGCQGKVLITTISSNVSRWQQAANVSLKYGRKIALAGRSIEKIFSIAKRLGYLKIPRNSVVKLKRIKNFSPKNVTIFVAGSQAQSSSALSRIAGKNYRGLEIKPGDKVIFSGDYIPGSELAVHGLIDDLSRLGATVSYSDILDDLHVSGHAAQAELALMINLTRPQYLVPIGGAFRQMKQYSLLAQRMGYQEEQILLPEGGDVIEILPGGQIRIGAKIRVKSKLVDSRIRGQV
jgi:ribonuclease J